MFLIYGHYGNSKMFYILALMGLEIRDGDVLCACRRNYVQGKHDLFGTNCSVEFVFY
jgi:hypothetical protein